MSLEKKEIVIDAVSKVTHGIKVGENWYNKSKELNDESKANVVDMVDQIGKGDKVSLEVDDKNEYYSITMIEKGKSGWDDMTNFKELLNTAHEKGLVSISTEMINVDWEKKTALFKAKVNMVHGKDKLESYKSYEAYGDATQDNIDSDKVKKSWIRMAETRAICRALRWATNNALVAEEELPGDDEGEIEIKKINQVDLAHPKALTKITNIMKEEYSNAKKQ